MLENSNLVQGVQGKEVDKLIAEYQDITLKLADLDKSKKEVLNRLFELAEVGVNETSKYAFNVVLNKGRETIGIKALKDKAPNLYNLIQEQKLVNIGEDYKTIRGIKLKGQRT